MNAEVTDLRKATVSYPKPTDLPPTNNASVAQRLTIAEEKLIKVDHALEGLKAYVSKLGVRVEDAEMAVEQLKTQGVAPVAPDTLTEQVYNWLVSVPGLKVTAHIVANNVEGCEDKAGPVRGRLESMANSGRIKKNKPEGKTTMFWYEAPVKAAE